MITINCNGKSTSLTASQFAIVCAGISYLAHDANMRRFSIVSQSSLLDLFNNLVSVGQNEPFFYVSKIVKNRFLKKQISNSSEFDLSFLNLFE